jgi:hypothetical protein
LYGAFKLILILERINPQLTYVPRCIANIFKTHQRYMLRERDVSVDVFHQPCEAGYRQGVQNHPNFNPDTVPGALLKSRDGLIEGTFGLNYVIMIACHIGIERHPQTKVRVLKGSKSSNVFRPCERSAIGQDV